MDAWWINVTAGIVATLIGVAVTRWVQPSTPPAAGNTGTIVGDQNNTHKTVSKRKIHIEVHNTRIGSQPTPKKGDADGPDWPTGLLVGGIFGIILLAVGYLYVREVALVTFAGIAWFAIAFVVAAWFASRRFTVVSGSLRVRMALLPLILIAVLVNRYLLTNADYPTDRLAGIVQSSVRLTPTNALDYATLSELAFLAYQAVSLLLSGVALMLVLASCVGLALQIRRARAGTATTVDTVALSPRLLGIPVVCALLALPFGSGSLYALTQKASASDSPQISASAKTSPHKADQILLCAEVDGVDPGDAFVILQMRSRGQQKHEWRQVGDTLELSANGTACEDVAAKKRPTSYRFVLSDNEARTRLRTDALSVARETKTGG